MIDYMGTHISDPDVRTVLDCIRRIVRALRLFDREAEKLAGLSGAQLFVLRNLGSATLSVNELAERTHTDQSSVSVVAEKLVRNGLVKRSRAAGDLRRAELQMTDQGRKVLRSSPAAAQERMIAGLKGLSSKERKLLAQLLVELIHKMGIEGETPGLFFEEKTSAKKIVRKGKLS
jgi:DNA-binding MarR family transcriptional regulator